MGKLADRPYLIPVRLHVSRLWGGGESMHGSREMSILRTKAFSSALLSALAGSVSSASSTYLMSSILILLLSIDMVRID